ncbi:MAG TPA: HAD-IIA family hydrolase [Nocardioidaceae bacterium]|nr:HAD-IIA family hydrolase [Nocardioidaceae bacterium]
MQEDHGHRLAGCARPLCERYDTVLFDLDGVVYVGSEAVPGAREAIDAARTAGMRPAFVTNNASRPPAQIAERLRELGVRAEARDVVTSAQAAARTVRRLVPEGAAVLVVGGDGLVEALAEHGLRAVTRMDQAPAAVVQGFSRDVGWRALAEAVAAVDAGLPWVASNLDATLPTPRGRAPGNGQLVDVVARTTGQRPWVAGKPERALFDETLLRVGGAHPLVVGDRLDTDIEGAVTCGLDSLLVLTGVTGVVELCRATPGARPSYVSRDLRGLLVAHPDVRVDTARPSGPGRAAVAASCAGWSCQATESSQAGDAQVSLTGSGDQDDAVRALVSACWAYRDAAATAVRAEAIATAWRQAELSAPAATVDQRAHEA